ncbi:MAG: hypothetical protein ABR975_06545 [Vulcanimicrobiaceae bacterium]
MAFVVANDSFCFRQRVTAREIRRSNEAGYTVIMKNVRPSASNVPKPHEDEHDRDEAVIAADDTGMVASERLVTVLETEPDRDRGDAGDV